MYPPKACLFDLDGLLLDTEELHGQSWKLAASKFGINLNRKQILSLRGRRRLDCINQIFQLREKDIRKEDFIKTHHHISKQLMRNSNAMPGAENLIEYCYLQQIPMALVTSSSANSLAVKIAPHPWINRIDTRVLGDDLELLKGKPFPDPFLLAAKRLQVKPNSCWAFEDSESGKKSALTAGCKVWVLIDSNNENNYPIKNLNLNPIYILELKSAYDELKKSLRTLND